MNTTTVAGIDVGGERKGCHLVILQGTRALMPSAAKRPEEMLHECLKLDVQAVGIDAPCQWGVEGKGRLAEKELARHRIFCFATPTRERAKQSSFYDWMRKGEELYQTFASAYPLLTSEDDTDGRVSFETFPHAVTCALRGRENTSARRKRVQRRQLLVDTGIDIAALKSIDDVDAALCALTARFMLAGQTEVYGDVESGFIRVPRALTPQLVNTL